MKKRNPVLNIMNEVWSSFDSSLASQARSHRLRFVADNKTLCNVNAVVKKRAVRSEGIPVGTPVRVLEVMYPAPSVNYVWRKVKRPYVSCAVRVGRKFQRCNLEALRPV